MRAPVIRAAKGDGPAAFVAARAIFTAFSTASEPVVTRAFFWQNRLAPSDSLFRTAPVRLVGQHLEAGVRQFFQLRFTAATTFGCRCPVLSTAMPPANQDTHGLQRPTPGSFPRDQQNGVNLPNATRNCLTAALH